MITCLPEIRETQKRRCRAVAIVLSLFIRWKKNYKWCKNKRIGCGNCKCFTCTIRLTNKIAKWNLDLILVESSGITCALWSDRRLWNSSLVLGVGMKLSREEDHAHYQALSCHLSGHFALGLEGVKTKISVDLQRINRVTCAWKYGVVFRNISPWWRAKQMRHEMRIWEFTLPQGSFRYYGDLQGIEKQSRMVT